LFLVVGLLAAAAWGLRRFGGARFGAPPEDAPELAVLATIPLGDRRSLSAVRFGERLLLIGSTAQAVTLLASREREPRNATPRMRSVADLLQAEETPDFARALASASARLARGAPLESDDR
jgi:flagellar biosynthetic protein FliO